MRAVCFTTVLVLGVLFATDSSALIVNGDFSLGNTGFTTDYLYEIVNHSHGDQGEGEYGINTDPNNFNSWFSHFGDHTPGTGNMMIINGDILPDRIVWSQTVPVLLNTGYIFSGWYASTYPTSPANLKITINGTQLGSNIQLLSTTGLWQQFSMPWNSGSNSLATFRIFDTTYIWSGNDFALDDLSLTQVQGETSAVPEPCTLLLLGAGLFGAAISRKARKL